MRLSIRSAIPFALWLVFVTGCGDADSGSRAVAQEVDADREARIVANLQATFPALRERTLRIDSLAATDIDGMHRGLIVVDGQSQPFLVTADDKELYLIAAGPIDVTRSVEDISREISAEADARRESLAEIIADAPAKGPANAPVTIVEFSDFQCPYCARAATTLKEVLPQYGDDVRVVYAHYPLPNHPWAKPAAVAAHCAAIQSNDAFWTLRDAYFTHQREFTTENVAAKSREVLAASGGEPLDLATWDECATDETSAAYAAATASVLEDLQRGEALGVSGTPHFFINGERLSGAQPAEAFENAIEQALANAR